MVWKLWKETDYKLSFIDGIILVLLYARIGLDLNARYDDFCWEDFMDGCTTDKDGRIVHLMMDPSPAADLITSTSFDLP